MREVSYWKIIHQVAPGRSILIAQNEALKMSVIHPEQPTDRFPISLHHKCRFPVWMEMFWMYLYFFVLLTSIYFKLAVWMENVARLIGKGCSKVRGEKIRMRKAHCAGGHDSSVDSHWSNWQRRKKAFRFKAAHDVDLLREAMAHKPWSASHGKVQSTCIAIASVLT